MSQEPGITAPLPRRSGLEADAAPGDQKAEQGGSPPPTPPPGGRRGRGADSRRGDRAFSGLVNAAAILILVILAAIAIFLVAQATGAIGKDKANFFTYQGWDPDGNNGSSKFGIGPLALGTLTSSLLAIIMATPIALGVALFTTHYAPRRVAQPLAYVVDLLAAVPSVVYGLWGIIFLVPHIETPSRWVDDALGWIPLFHSPSGAYGRSIFTASVVLAIMVLPIVSAISREVFAQTPRENIEAAYALGATRWEMIRYAVLPYGRSGVTSAIVLGFGRALGETIAVALVLSANFKYVIHLLEPGGNTIAANIATQFADALSVGRGALIASGLVLFVITLLVNYLARTISRRGISEAVR